MHKYKKIERLGEGAHGVVFKAELLPESERRKESKKRKQLEIQTEQEQQTTEELQKNEKQELKQYVAIKKIRLKSRQEGLSQEAIREIRLLQELDHPNIMKVIDIFSHSSNINVVIEYMTTDLDHILRASELIITAADIKSYMRMLLLAVEHCHKNWILHRDIKPGNLLIGEDGQMKLADFGLAKIYGSPDRSLSHQACTLYYRAPELLFGARMYGPGADMWSVGCVFGELMKRIPMFPGTGELDQLSKIFSCLGTPTEKDWPGMTKLPSYTEFNPWPPTPLESIFTAATSDALDLLRNLLRYDPKQRLSATQALAHRYFTNLPVPTLPSSLPRLISQAKKKKK